MKILFSHLKNYFHDKLDIDSVSNLLFQLGHENEVHKDILDIEFTPNKGDCLSVFGIARDLNTVHKTNLDIDIYSGHINELDFNFNNDLLKSSEYFTYLVLMIFPIGIPSDK